MTYVIRSGDTLYSIARRFNTTVDEILSLNPQITDPDLIFPGQVINLPEAEPTDNCPFLQRGDRGPAVRRLQILLRTARYDPGPVDGIFGPRTEAALREFQRNTREIDITGTANLETWIALGAICEPFDEIIEYTVRPGDTLFIIATRFNLSVDDILAVNPGIINPNLIFAGQIINIPPRP